MLRCNGADKVKVCQESDCVESALRSENVMSNGFVFPGTAGCSRNGLCRAHERVATGPKEEQKQVRKAGCGESRTPGLDAVKGASPTYAYFSAFSHREAV